MKPGIRTGITRIEIRAEPQADPKACVHWRKIEIPTKVVDHFGQSKGSPFTVPPISDGLGFCEDGPASMLMLHGSYDVSQLEANVALLVQHIKQTSKTAAIEMHPTITTDEYVGKLKIWAESTSTSPSGLHLGYYNALIARHKYSDIDTDDTELLAKRDTWNRMQTSLLD